MAMAVRSGPAETRPIPGFADTLLGNLPSPVIALGREVEIKFVNPAAEQLLRASQHVLRGRPLTELLGPHTKLIELARQVQETGNSISDYGMEMSLTRGEVMQIDGHLAPIVEQPGWVVMVLQPCSVARSMDVHRSQRGSTRSVAALAATLAHEVKNPLSGIRGAAQLLEPNVEADDLPLVKLICDEADRIVGIVDRMEEFALPGRVKREPVNIHQVLEHVRRIASAGFARSLRIVEQYDPSLPHVEGDRDRLIQVFLNLVKNAAEAVTPEGGQITISTHYQHGVRMSFGNTQERQDLPITVEIRDNGAGVPEDMLEHLFEPFISTKPKGSGLGLSLVARIVSDHGGLVTYHPADPGAIFRVRLPTARRGAMRTLGEDLS